ncbi:hypothetical protein [Halorussus lipolyticus]|uniref:hypothetical protein n=1 Tax=Halorussus lipolyticus TaxID=3034024 RepID=UPI0023E87872|nr:hypothetical protein [Halorussus sp. DT80]
MASETRENIVDATTENETIVGSETVRRTWSSAVLGGLTGGLAFGVLLQMMGMMPVIAALYGMESVAFGWAAHLFHSVAFALVFAGAVTQTDYRDAGIGRITALGAGYGLLVWLVAAAVVMPLWLGALGMDAPAIPNLDANSLVGHLVYGVVLGAVFAVARQR